MIFIGQRLKIHAKSASDGPLDRSNLTLWRWGQRGGSGGGAGVFSAAQRHFAEELMKTSKRIDVRLQEGVLTCQIH